jgi:hypothetical protein
MNMQITPPLAQPQFVQDMSAQQPPGIKAAPFITPMQITAPQLLNKAASIMESRAATYDKPEGERSMAATVTAFNAITGQQLTEAHGWLMMAVLKMVRDNQRSEAHQDSCEDLVAYASLYGEARLK